MERILNAEGLLEPNTYAGPPKFMKWKYLFKKNWHFLPFTLIVLVLTAFFLVTQGISSGTLALLGMCFALLAIAILAFRQHFFKHFEPFYTVHGVNVSFGSEQYYVPEEVMGGFLLEVFDKFKHLTEGDPAKLFQGISLHITDQRPTDPMGIRTNLVGVTYTKLQRASYVYGPYALSHGGAGYELRLHGVAALYPDHTEGEDIQWMKDNHVI